MTSVWLVLSLHEVSPYMIATSIESIHSTKELAEAAAARRKKRYPDMLYEDTVKEWKVDCDE